MTPDIASPFNHRFGEVSRSRRPPRQGVEGDRDGRPEDEQVLTAIPSRFSPKGSRLRRWSWESTDRQYPGRGSERPLDSAATCSLSTASSPARKRKPGWQPLSGWRHGLRRGKEAVYWRSITTYFVSARERRRQLAADPAYVEGVPQRGSGPGPRAEARLRQAGRQSGMKEESVG